MLAAAVAQCSHSVLPGCLPICRCTIPELNPEMDVYRIGTMLEMAREIAWQLAQDGKSVKVCVQQSMGQGVFQVKGTTAEPQLS